jgi:hypothetical protein
MSIGEKQNPILADIPTSTTVCVTFRHQDGSREYAYLEKLPIGGESITRSGTAYVVAAIGTDGAGNTMVTLEQAPLADG